MLAGVPQRGVYAAMVTPLTADREIDPTATGRVVDRLINRGITGLAILGSTGECAGLTRRQRRNMAEVVVAAVAGRAATIGGVAGTALEDVAADLRELGEVGLMAVLVPPPFYFMLDTDGVIEFYERLAEASPLPLLLYNIPQTTKVPISVQAVERLADHPQIVGLKDSSGNLAYFTEIAQLGRPDFAVFTGADTLLAPALLVGGYGLIGAGGNVAPDLFAQVFRAFEQGDRDRAMALQLRANAAMAAVRVGGYPANFKAALAVQGLCGTTMTRPLPELREAELAQLRAQLHAIDLWVPVGESTDTDIVRS